MTSRAPRRISVADGRRSQAAEAPLQIQLVVILGALVVLDVLICLIGQEPVLATVFTGATGLYAVANPRVGGSLLSSPVTRTIAAGAASLGATALAYVGERPSLIGPGQTVIGLLLIVVAARYCSPRWSLPCVVVGLVAVTVGPLRVVAVRSDVDGSVLLAMALLGICAVAVAGLGYYLRDLDRRARAAADAARDSERTAMATDLHDFVAHHVTGILVQAQVAKMLADTDPTQLPRVLDDIANSAGQALRSMRATVGALRNVTEPGDRGPVHDLTTLSELLAASGTDHGPRLSLEVDDGLADSLPQPVQAAIYRVVQEGLTNTRKHAGAATAVRIAVRRRGRDAVVEIADDAPRSTASHREPGFGLIGLTERVTALGGVLDAVHADGGFTLTASIPVT